jgi:hypothetical protein
MREMRRAGITVAILLTALLVVNESHHLFRYGHLAPLGLHVDATVTHSQEILGVRGTTEIYQAQLKQYGVFPATITVCDYLNSDIRDTMINYVVERRRTSADPWLVVPEWSEYGSRFFCRTSFEVTGTHLVRRRLWPGQAMQFGWVAPAQMGFQIGDHGRFSVFLAGDNDFKNSRYSGAFYVNEPKR